MIGIDLGISSLMITSDGDKVANPKQFKKHYRRLRKVQKVFLENRKGQKIEKKQELR